MEVVVVDVSCWSDSSVDDLCVAERRSISESATLYWLANQGRPEVITFDEVFVGEVDSSCVETIFSYVSTADCKGVVRISLEVSIKFSFSWSIFEISNSLSVDSSVKLDEGSEAVDFSSLAPRLVIVSFTYDTGRTIRSSKPWCSCSSLTDARNYNRKNEQYL
jgi:hypothetical protein